MLRRLLQSRPATGNNPGILGQRKIHLHLGAHKTATTYLQKTLAKNRDALLENGVLYLPLGETRLKVTKHLLALCRETRDESTLSGHRAALIEGLGPERLERCHTILISDENLAGSPTRIRKGSIYEGITTNFNHIRSELGPDVSVFFSIRDYPGFLASLYAEMLRKAPYFPFDKIRGIFGDTPTLWPDVYRDLVSTFGKESISLWDFRDSVGNPGPVLSMLAGVDMTFDIHDMPARESISASAIAFLRDFKKLPGKPLPAKILCEVANRLYPLSSHPEKFNPWGTGEREHLARIYQEHKVSLPVRTFA